MPWPRWRACARWQRCTSESMPCLRQKTCNRNSRPGQAYGSIALRLHHEPAETERRKEVPIMDGMGEQAALAARASRGTHWPLIPTCTLRGHSKMGKIGHGVKKLRIVLKSLQLVTKGINHGIKGGKDTVRKSFFP